MPWNLLLLPLIGGYVFYALHPTLSYRLGRLPKDRLLIESAVIGIVLGAVSLGVTRVLIAEAPHLAQWWKAFAPWPYSGTAAGALLLGAASGLAAAITLHVLGKTERGRQAWVTKHGNELERLFYRSIAEFKPLMVSLVDNKVYVGQIE